LLNTNNREVLTLIKTEFGFDQTHYTADNNPNRDKLHKLGLTKSLEHLSNKLLENSNYLLESIRIKLQQHHTDFLVNKYESKNLKSDLTIQSILHYAFKDHMSRTSIYTTIELLSGTPEKKLYDTSTMEFGKA